VSRCGELHGSLLQYWNDSDVIKVNDDRIKEACDEQEVVFKYKDPVKCMIRMLENEDLKDYIVYQANAHW
jgi:hypothetical protein